MADFISTRLGQQFCEVIPHLLMQLVEEKKRGNDIAEAMLYPYPDLCRRCANKDTDECLRCTSSNVVGNPPKRAIRFKAVQ